MPAAEIRAGKAFVEIFVKGGAAAGKTLDKFAAKFKATAESIRAAGENISALGGGLTKLGLAVAAPLGLASKGFASFEQSLANIKAAANPTAAQMETVSAAINKIAGETGKGPTEVAEAFGELLKAGMPLSAVLGGAAEAAVKFAQVGELQVGEAATVMSDALNVFAKEGMTATAAVDILSKAADASSVSIEQITQAFSQSSAVFGGAGIKMNDLAVAIGLLGNAGVKGSDAGTSLKTLFSRLQAPAEDAAAVIAQLGINVRDATGHMLPMEGIIGELERTLGKLAPAAQDQAMAKLFGSDAIRAGRIMLDKGAQGFREFGESMKTSLGVGEKFAIMGDTVEGGMSMLKVSVIQAGNAVGKVLAPFVREMAGRLAGAAQLMGDFVEKNQGVVVAIASIAGGALAAGAALLGLGAAVRLLGSAALLAFQPIGLGLGIVKMILSPLGLMAVALGGVTAAILSANGAGEKLASTFGEAFAKVGAAVAAAMAGVKDSLAAGDIAAAAAIMWAGVKLAWLEGTDPLRKIWIDLKQFLADGMYSLWAGAQIIWVTGVAAIETTFADAVANIKILWVGLKQTVSEVFDWISKKGASIASYLPGGSSLGASLAAADAVRNSPAGVKAQQAEDLKKARDAQAEVASAQDERDRRAAAAAAKKKASEIAIDDALRGRLGDSSDARNDQDAARGDAIAAGRKELADMVASAARAAASKNFLDNFGDEETGGAAAAGVKLAAVGGTVEMAANKYESAGTFNSSLVGGLAGGSVVTKIAKNTEQTAIHLQQVVKLNERMVDDVSALLPKFA